MSRGQKNLKKGIENRTKFENKPMRRTENYQDSIFLRDFIHRKLKNIKNFKIINKENKISHGRGNSLRKKLRGWVDLDSNDPLKPLPTG